jgi:beta-glucosidase
VEGEDVHSDWWRYEREPGNVQNFFEFPEFGQQFKSDHWRQFPEDIVRMKADLGLNAYRFSLDWSRIEPVEGQWDEAVIDRYVSLCGQMRELGIRPLVTLFHWSSPDWIWEPGNEESSGWYHPSIVDRFGAFCERVVQSLAKVVDLWVTFNEPNVFLYGGFSEGVLAPGHCRPDRELLPIQRHLLLCHRNAYRTIHESRDGAQVGIAQQITPFEPVSRWNPLEGWLSARVEQAFSWAFGDSIHTGELVLPTRSGAVIREQIEGLSGTVDFSGVNYYERMLLRIPWGVCVQRVEAIHDHFGTKEIWPREINTRAFVEILERVQSRYGLPIYVTENGRSHSDDSQRQRFLEQHLCALGHALENLDVDVRGYFYWSLLDNQEWANGFTPRLGLYEVDYSDGSRSLRDTGRRYAEIIQSGEICADSLI